MGGIVLGALGGAGEAAMRIGDNMQRGAIQADLENLRSENDLNRAKAMERFKMEIGNNQREDMLRRRETAKTGIIDAAIQDKYADPVMGSEPLTPEQQTVLDQGIKQQQTDKAKDRKAMSRDRKVDIEAGVKTGEISLKDAAGMDQKDAANETRLMISQLRTDALNARTEAQFEVGMAKLEAAISKAGAGNTDFDKKIKLLKDAGATPKQIANFITERKQPSLEDLAYGLIKADPNAGTKKALTPAAAMEKAKELRALTQGLMDEDGEPAATPKPSPAPGAPAKPATPAKRLTFDPATGTFK